MTTDLKTILATKIRDALELNPDANPVHEALKLGQLAVLVHQAGLSLTPLPEQDIEVQRHPSGVEVTADGWEVSVDGEWAGVISSRASGYYAYSAGREYAGLESLDAAVSHLVSLKRATPSPERSIERGRDDAEEDSRREDGEPDR